MFSKIVKITCTHVLFLSRDSIPTILVRACKTMCHEIGHMFGLRHCIHFHCLMNGSNHLEESDSRPSFLCPVCLRKLHSSCQFEIKARYQQMLEFWSAQKLDVQTKWLQERLKRLEEMPSTSWRALKSVLIKSVQFLRVLHIALVADWYVAWKRSTQFAYQ